MTSISCNVTSPNSSLDVFFVSLLVAAGGAEEAMGVGFEDVGFEDVVFEAVVFEDCWKADKDILGGEVDEVETVVLE